MGTGSKNRIITLTTDFGSRDHYSGSLKGAILSINPKATITDISHEIPSYDIAQGAITLASCYHLFPRQTIHVGVVDPGVGSERLPIVIETDRYFFVGPDNGLFSLAAPKSAIRGIRHLENQKYFRSDISDTFHGRDLFAPVAAHLSRGVPIRNFGGPLKAIHRLELFQVTLTDKKIRSQVVSIDKFGNAITGITGTLFQKHIGRRRFQVKVGSHTIHQLCRTYSEAPPGMPVMVIASNNLLEMALYQGNLASLWQLKVGQDVTVKIKEFI